MKPLCIGEKIAQIPIIQGGMGVGVSRSSLAGAVAAEGGIGVISSAQIGYDEEGFEKNQEECNLSSLRKHILKAKEIAEGKGLIGVNVMVALKHYKDHVKEAVKAGADVVICGAGLPLDLPELVAESETKIAPIISSVRASDLILKMWDKKYNRTADFLVFEGPKAGGHLGFSLDQLQPDGATDAFDTDAEIRGIIETKKRYEEKYQCQIPVIVAGGIFDHDDVTHALELGADGVQVASRFVATYECDASDAYKQAYIDATADDIEIIKSPVGMPGRALGNSFIQAVRRRKEPVEKCYQCLAKCNPAEIPYCITKALIKAVQGDLENGLVFCGANVGRIQKLMSVREVIQELKGE